MKFFVHHIGWMITDYKLRNDQISYFLIGFACYLLVRTKSGHAKVVILTLFLGLLGVGVVTKNGLGR